MKAKQPDQSERGISAEIRGLIQFKVITDGHNGYDNFNRSRSAIRHQRSQGIVMLGGLAWACLGHV
jgi:hypothetical protein